LLTPEPRSPRGHLIETYKILAGKDGIQRLVL